MRLAVAIARFLAHFMASPQSNLPDLPFLFPRGPLIIPILTWAHSIRQYDPSEVCVIEKVIHYKCNTDKEHEFLLIHAQHNRSGVSVVLAADRAPEPVSEASSTVPSSGAKLDGLAILSSGEVPACDRIIVSYDGTENTVLMAFKTRATALRSLHYRSPDSAPTLSQFAAILEVVSEHAPQYDLYETQCFWFAGAAWDTLKALFPTSEQQHSRKASSYLGIHITQKNATATLTSAYNARWNQIMETTREQEERRLLSEERVLSFMVSSLINGLITFFSIGKQVGGKFELS
jgi:hypothetical protein